MFEMGFTRNNQNIIDSMYKEMVEIYSKISFVDAFEIKRMHPVLWKKYKDIENRIDKEGKDYSTDDFQSCKSQIIGTWNKIAEEILKEVDKCVKKGMKQPQKKNVDFALSFYKDENGSSDFVSCGMVPISILKRWFSGELSTSQVEALSNNGFKDELVIGPCGLQNDNKPLMNHKNKENKLPSLQNCSVLSPEEPELEDVFKESKKESVGVVQGDLLIMELDGPIVEAWNE